jgi:hypothetical protein
MLLYLSDPENPTKKLLEIINTLKIPDTKIDLPNFLYTNSAHIEKEFRKRIPFSIASKKIGLNLTKEVKDLYNEKYKLLKKEIEDFRSPMLTD